MLNGCAGSGVGEGVGVTVGIGVDVGVGGNGVCVGNIGVETGSVAVALIIRLPVSTQPDSMTSNTNNMPAFDKDRNLVNIVFLNRCKQLSYYYLFYRPNASAFWYISNLTLLCQA